MGRWSDLSLQNLLIISKVGQLGLGLIIFRFVLHFHGHKFVDVPVGCTNRIAGRLNTYNEYADL